MAYFDKPENMEKWQQELKVLREERLRRQNKGVQPVPEAGEAEAAAEASAAPRTSAARTDTQKGVRAATRVEITLEQLEEEAGIKKAPSASASKTLARQKELTADREMN